MTATLPETTTATLPAQAAPVDETAGTVAAAHPHAPTAPVDPRSAVQVVLSGALSQSDSARIARLVEESATRAGVVQVDLSAVHSIDADVARAFLHAAWRLEASGRRVVLVSPRPPVRRVLYWQGADYLVPRESRSARRARRGRAARRPPWDS